MVLQVPGGPEFAVMLVVALVLFGIPLVLVLVLGTLWIRSNQDDEEVTRQIAELQAEVRELRTELQDDDGNYADEGEDTSGSRGAGDGGNA
jgi:type II secretory pathway pseudopilin PulG